MLQYKIKRTMHILPKGDLSLKNKSIQQDTGRIGKYKPRQTSQNMPFQSFKSQSDACPKYEKWVKGEEDCRLNTEASQSQRGDDNDVQRLIIKNKLTLNLIDQQNIGVMGLSPPSSFQSIKTLLVPIPLYERFQSKNHEYGESSSLLSRLEREYDANNSKIKISRDSQVMVRISRFGIKQINRTTQSKLSNPRFTLPSQDIVKHLILPKSRLSIKSKKQKEINVDLGGKWRLKDFLQHIPQQVERDYLQAIKHREREAILQRLKRINEQCSQAESKSKQISKSITVFAKYNEQLSDKLVRKQRKIDKIYYFQHY